MCIVFIIVFEEFLYYVKLHTVQCRCILGLHMSGFAAFFTLINNVLMLCKFFTVPLLLRQNRIADMNRVLCAVLKSCIALVIKMF